MIGVKPNFINKNNNILIFINLFFSVLTIFWFLHYAKYGLDFSDEGAYLNYIAYPYEYTFNLPITLFGFIYHPFYVLFNENIVLLRIFNVLLTFSLAFFLIKKINIVNEKPFVLNIAIACTSLLFFSIGILTPNYNILTFQSVILSLIGLLKIVKIESDNRYEKIIGAIFIGVGGWLCFMGKPSSAMLLAIIFVVYLFFIKKLFTLHTVISICTAIILLLLSCYLIDGSIISFSDRIIESIKLQFSLANGHTFANLFRFDTFPPLNINYIFFIIIFEVIFFYLLIKNLLHKYILYIFFITGLSILLFCILSPNNYINIFSDRLILIFTPISCIISIILLYFNKININWENLSLVIIMLSMPYVCTIGTDGNYWQTQSLYSYFWILASILILNSVEKDKNNLMLFFPFFTQLITFMLLNQYISERPYRQPAIKTNNYTCNLINNNILKLGSNVCEYIKTAEYQAKKSGLKEGDYIIDLTGQSPTIIYLLKAKSIGQPWLIGGYAGSNIFASLILRNKSCEKLAKAWILFEPNGPRSLSAEILKEFGSNINEYAIKTIFNTPVTAGGYSFSRKQYLMKYNEERQKLLYNCLNNKKHPL